LQGAKKFYGRKKFYNIGYWTQWRQHSGRTLAPSSWG